MRVDVDVDVRKRVIIAGEKLLEAEGAGGVARTDQDDVALTVGDQPHPPQDEGPKEELAEFGIGLD